ncbi:MAG TPA: DNA primase [Candidatus Limnocylindrales bacterium]|nr:DNA primase [Candidatus Limnocylindrales bacterium]
MIAQDKIAEIRHRASIIEVISDYIPLKKAGRNHMGLCPFHAEKSPSFTVSEEKGIYHCFGCHAGGSVFHFLMQYDHLTFPEAVERVAKRYGITIEAGARTGNTQETGERERLYRVNEQAAANYQKILFGHPEGRHALAYLKARGVDEATARKYMLGYAPQTGSGLLSLAKKENFSVNDALRLGLVGQRGQQQYYEKFFARVMFPIVNPAGKVVGFGGRVMNQGMPKYLNSSETPLFRKGATLYGLYQAKEGIRQADRAVVVEGYLDAIALAQYGVAYSVATLGTALTVEHVRALSRYTKNIIALFDGDDAGLKAAARSFEIFIEAGMLGRAAFLPKGEDPDTFVRANGKAALEAVLARAVPLADFYFSWLEQRCGKTLEGKSRIAGEISRVLAKVTNAFEVDLLVRRAVDMLGIREESLRRPAVAPGVRPASARALAVPAEQGNRDDIAERSLVSLMLRLPAVLASVAHENEARQWFSTKWRPLVDGIITEWQERRNVDVSELMHQLSPEQAQEIAALVLEGDKLSDAECGKMANDCLLYLRRKFLKSLERNLRVAIRTAEEQKDENAKRERMLEWQDLLRKERQLERPRLESKPTIR